MSLTEFEEIVSVDVARWWWFESEFQDPGKAGEGVQIQTNLLGSLNLPSFLSEMPIKQTLYANN